jgi:hypothetical protein
MHFELIGQIKDIESIAVGRGVHGRSRLNKLYGIVGTDSEFAAL